MEDKARQLWFLLEGIDRKDPKALRALDQDKLLYPYFYLLKWNEKVNESDIRKINLQSIFPSNFKHSYLDAPEYKEMIATTLSEDFTLDTKNQQAIIDEFLEKLPSINRVKKKEELELTEEVDYSEQEFELPVSETFGKILIKQGKIVQAIEVFERLSLKIPEKKTYFASLIQELNEKLTEL